MNQKDINTLKMIASNCNLEKVQRDMLTEIIEREEEYRWHDGSENPDEMKMIVVGYSDFEDDTIIYYKLLIYEKGEFDKIHDEGYLVRRWKYLDI